jgi:hypothetical protein
MKLVIATVGIKPQLKVFLENGHSSVTVFSDTDEWYIRFAKIYWTEDSRICGWYVSGLNKAILVAFDTGSGRQVDPALVRDKIKEGIIEKYRLRSHVIADPSFDALVWTGTREAEDAFIEAGTEPQSSSK